MLNRIIFLLLFVPATVVADETCTRDVIGNFFDCIDTGVFSECLAQYPQCDNDDISAGVAAEYIVDYYAELCCKKPKTKKILSCIKNKRALFRSTKRAMPKNLRTRTLEEIAVLQQAVKTNGKCPD